MHGRYNITGIPYRWVRLSRTPNALWRVIIVDDMESSSVYED
jgi:hypothetical protein